MKKLIFLLSVFISFSCSNPTETVPAADADQLVEDLTTMSIDFQISIHRKGLEHCKQMDLGGIRNNYL